MKNHTNYGQQPVFQIYCIFSGVSINILQKRIYAVSVHGLAWTCETTTSVMEQKRRIRVPFNKIYNKSTHSRKWMNKATGHEQCWRQPSIESLLELQLGCWWEARCNSPHISQSETCFHHLQRHHLVRRQQGQGWRDAITPWHASLCHQTSINGGLSTISHETMNNHCCKMMSLSHWRWSYHADIN
jgi:hypothetical protein